jgi:hypothetical protein
MPQATFSSGAVRPGTLDIRRRPHASALVEWLNRFLTSRSADLFLSQIVAEFRRLAVSEGQTVVFRIDATNYAV